MKALIYNGKEEITLQEAKEPYNPKEIRVRINACGICGSDLHAYHGHDERRPSPLILGHEAYGVAENGKFTDQQVVINPLVSCGECGYCESGRENLCTKREILSLPPRQGAFAEYVSIPESNLILLQSQVDFVNLHALTEPMATCYHALKLLFNIGVDGNLVSDCLNKTDKILIIGGGAIGLGCLEILLTLNIPPQLIFLIEKNPLRLEKIKQSYHIDVNPEIDLTNKAGYIIDAVGNQATHTISSKACAPGGTIVRVGLEQANYGYDIRKHTLQQITLIGSYTYTQKDFMETYQLLIDNNLHPQWVETMPLEQGAEAFASLSKGTTPYSKIILKIN